MGKALETANRYYDAVRDKGAGLADVLADEVTFNGPLVQWTGKAEFLEGFKQMAAGMAGVRMLKQFEDGGEVCSIFEMDLNTPKGPVTANMSEWVKVSNGRITSARLHFDPRALLEAMS